MSSLTTSATTTALVFRYRGPLTERMREYLSVSTSAVVCTTIRQRQPYLSRGDVLDGCLLVVLLPLLPEGFAVVLIAIVVCDGDVPWSSCVRFDGWGARDVIRFQSTRTVPTSV